MGKLILVVTVILTIPLLGCEKPKNPDRDRRLAESIDTDKMAVNLDAAAEWLVINGYPAYKELGFKGLSDHITDTWKVLLWLEPYIEERGMLAQFRVRSLGMSYQIHNLHRVEHDGVFYEFWAVRTMPKSWTGHSGKTTFYITSTDDIYHQRQIITKDTQFREQYELQNFTINVPVDNLKMLYPLQPWDYPNNYLYSDVDETELYMNGDGEIKKKWWLWP